jgi:hypothetical protein
VQAAQGKRHAASAAILCLLGLVLEKQEKMHSWHPTMIAEDNQNTKQGQRRLQQRRNTAIP